MWAIKTNGVGKQVGARAVQPDWPLAEGEAFTVDSWTPGMVLAEDGVSLRDPLPQDETPAVPTLCTRRQGRLVLLEAEKLDTVEAFIASISDPVQKARAQIEYEAETWERSNEFLQQVWASIGGTEAELDALFIDAVTR